MVKAVTSGYSFHNINEPLYYFTVDKKSKYRSDVRGTTLHAIHAINQNRFEMTPREFSELDDELSELLSDEEMGMYLKEMAQESLRFGRKGKARYYARRGLPSVAMFGILVLSFMPQIVINGTVRVYRVLQNRSR